MVKKPSTWQLIRWHFSIGDLLILAGLGIWSEMNKLKALWQQVVFAWWKLIFAYKHLTGFLDLGRNIEVTGTVLNVEDSSDGDFCFNLALDLEYSWANLVFGRHTTENPKYPDSLHCEITPWDRFMFTELLPRIKPGVRVRISGRWGFDGVHVHPSKTGFWAEVLEVIYALIRHQPNVLEGWAECHPVKSLKLLD